MAKAGKLRWRHLDIAISSRSRRAIAAIALVAVVASGGGDAIARADQAQTGKDTIDSIKLAPIVVPIIGPRSILGQAGVQVQLQLADPRDFNLIDRARGRLVDAFFRDLYVLFDQLQGAPDDVSPATIREHLMLAADRVLGPGKIRDIVILGSYERRNRS